VVAAAGGAATSRVRAARAGANASKKLWGRSSDRFIGRT
jgi:hypothetical protein